MYCKEVGSVGGSINASSEKSFTLHWIAETGEHDYTVKLYSLYSSSSVTSATNTYSTNNLRLSSTLDDQHRKEEDEDNGTIRVRRSDQQFAVSLEAFPAELEGGGTVWFTVHVENFENTALSLSGFVEDENGAVIKRIDGFEGRIPVGGKNISFSYTISGVGNHTFKVFLDNSDGKPNGVGEEHWAAVTVEVGGKIASPNLACTKEVPPGDTITCVASWNQQISIDSLELQQIWFGGKKVWKDGTSSVKSVVMDSRSYTLTPSNTIQVRIILDDNFANWYFGKSPWDPLDASYKDRLGGYTYKVKFIFEENVVSEDLVMVKDLDLIEKTKAFVSDFENDIKAGEYVAAGLLALKTGSKVARGAGVLFTAILIGIDIHDWLLAPDPDSGFDNNDVVGG